MNYSTKLVEKIRKSRKLRIAAAHKHHLFFFSIYLGNYALKFATADFQREIFALTQDNSVKLCIIVAFRDSAKSTICTTSFPLWSVLTDKTKFAVIASQTMIQARQHLENIKKEVEENELLKNDLGPFREERDQWGAYALSFSRYDAKIMAVSSGQSIRGLRHKSHRPALIICDDVEDLQSVRTQESRSKTYQWFKGEILPAASHDARIFVVGNLLHQDALIVRLRDEISSGKTQGDFRYYPVISTDGKSMWPSKYPGIEAIETERRRIGDNIAWEREYMLRIVAPDDQVIKREWIQYYE